MTNKDRNIRLSIIVPGYNTSEYQWERCIRSIQGSIGADDEIICIDDGSTVPTPFIDTISKEDSRVHVIHQHNQGLSAARNTGISHALGRYTAFADSDDEVVPGIYDEAISRMEDTGSDVCLFGVHVIWTDIRLHKKDIPARCNYGKPTASDVNRLYNGHVLNYAYNKVYRRECLNGLKGAENGKWFDPEGMPCEDIIFNLSLITSGTTWCSLDSIGYIYYRTDGTLLSTYKPSNLKGTTHAAATWQKYCDYDEQAKEYFSDKTVISQKDIALSEWKNIWMPKSPFNMKERYEWLKNNKDKFAKDSSTLMLFIKRALMTFARRYMYFRFIRRIHIKHMFQDATDIG